MSALPRLPPDVEKMWITVDNSLFPCISPRDLALFRVDIKRWGISINFIHSLSTVSTALSTSKKDNFYRLTSVFISFPQKVAPPITTIFIYNYLSSLSERSLHSVIRGKCVKLSNRSFQHILRTTLMRGSP